MRKVWMCLLLSFAVLLSTAVPAAAAEITDPLHQKLIESYYSGETVDLGYWHLPVSELEEAHDYLYFSGQLPWYAESYFSYSHLEGNATSFTPVLLDEAVYDRELYEQKIAEVIAEACLPGMTDWQLALSVHDYIILHTVYDGTYEKNTGYDALVNGTAVCSGYSELYMDVMNRLGIPCQLVICEDTGDGEGHGWNLLQVQRQWYHVDLTWDDPVQDIYGRVNHDYFLRTEDEFLTGETPHDFGWEALESAAQEPFIWDDFLEDSCSTVCFVTPVTAVYRTEEENTNRIVAMDMTTGETWTLYEYERMGMDLGDGTYLYPTLGLSFWNGRIYFNREDSVISMLPDGSDVQEVYYREPDDRYLLGCWANDGILHLSLMDHNSNVSAMEVEMEDVQFHTHNYVTYTTAPTCKMAGRSEQFCSCGIRCNYREIPTLDHELSFEMVREATQEETGMVWIHCLQCDYEQWDETPKEPQTMAAELWEQIDFLPMLGSVGLGVLILAAMIRKKKH